jgi:hypothetical protein
MQELSAAAAGRGAAPACAADAPALPAFTRFADVRDMFTFVAFGAPRFDYVRRLPAGPGTITLETAFDALRRGVEPFARRSRRGRQRALLDQALAGLDAALAHYRGGRRRAGRLTLELARCRFVEAGSTQAAPRARAEAQALAAQLDALAARAAAAGD